MEKREESSTGLAQGHQQLTMLLNTPRRDSQGPIAQKQAPPHTSLSTPNPVAVPTTESLLTPKLQNVVATVDLKCQLDLRHISYRTRNSEYNPKRFTGIVMRIREPRTTALIFSSGKIVVTGARNENDAMLAARKFTAIIKKLGFNIQFSNFTVQNIVATIDLKFPIKLEQLHEIHCQFSSYEPELFPGLVYRLVKPRVVFLIFVNGRIVMTGAKLKQELEEAIEYMFPILKSFKK